MKKLSFLLLVFPLDVLSAEEGMPGVSQAAQVMLALLVVLAVIVGLAMLVRKMNLLPVPQDRLINILATSTLGRHEKLVLIQVGEEQILLSQGNGHIRKVHKLAENISVPETAAVNGKTSFQQLLANTLARGNSGAGDGNA